MTHQAVRQDDKDWKMAGLNFDLRIKCAIRENKSLWEHL